MSRIRNRLACLVLLTVATAGCEGGTATEPDGEVRGVVMVEGTGLAGVTVELIGPQTRNATTDNSGHFTFDEVPTGAFVVSVRNLPEDASFPATSRAAEVSGSQTVTVDFLGNYIRTASISGAVVAGSQGLSGVTVELTGVETRETLTGEGGAFQFTGLRAGSYEVEISDLPSSTTFPVTRTPVELSTGESRFTNFEGSTELTASVVVRSISRSTSQGGSEPADPQNLRGTIDVTLTVDRGEDTLVSLELLLGDEVVGQQLFDGNVPSPEAEPTGPAGATPLDIVFTVGTAEFDAETGDVRFENGPRLLTARLATDEGGPSAWLASVPVQLRNADTFTGSVMAEKGPVSGDDGEDWVGGSLVAEIIPVQYDPSRSVSSTTVEIRREQGSQTRVRTAGGSAPFSVAFEADAPPGPDNVAGYQTPLGATDEVRVVSGTYEGGGVVPGVPTVIASELRIDNLGPEPAQFSLPQQSSGSDCCLQNWVGADFEFADGIELAEDGGVGGVSASVHAGASDLSDAEIAAGPEVLVGSDLSPTPGNSAYRAVAVSRDALGNERLSPLAVSPNNVLANPSGAVFGVDLALPQVAFSPAGVPVRAVNPSPGSAWVIEVDDAVSGAGPMPSRATVRLVAPDVEPGTAEACLFPGTVECLPSEDGLARSVPAGPEGYLIFESVALDRAGNRSNPRSRSILRDETPPTVLSVSEPPAPLIPGTPTSLAALVEDNVDLHRGWVSFEFDTGGGGALPPVAVFAAPQMLGVPFEGDLTSTASLLRTSVLVIGLEDVVDTGGTASPSGVSRGLRNLRVVVQDAAGHTTVRSEPLAESAGFTPRSFSVEERGASGGVGEWTLSAGGTVVCREDAECAAESSESIALTAVARGAGGALQEPFASVHFLLLDDGEPKWIGSSEASALEDGAGPLGRSWTWSIEWVPDPDVPLGPVELVAIGVDSDGNALRTFVLDGVTVDG